MKVRFVPLGKGKLDTLGFSYQYHKNLGVWYVRLGLFAVMFSLHGYDPVADLQEKIYARKADPTLSMTFNRHQRRAMMKQARHAKAR